MDALVAPVTPSEASDGAGGHTEAQTIASSIDDSSLTQAGAETEPSQEPNRVAHNADEYDPANPSGDTGDQHDAASTQDVAQKRPHVDDANLKNDGISPSPAKRVRGAAATSPVSPTSPVSVANSTPRAVDKRGLSDSAWDRLMDLESCGEFRVSQVSRAAFSSIATLPEFAQCMVVARFARTPMTDVRDKNGLVMRVFHEYLRENPHIQSLQPVSTFIADAVSDPGLFAYGYAPPMPTTGMSTVQVPYRFDKPEPAKTKATVSVRAEKREASEKKPGSSTPSAAATQSDIDEFGRSKKAPVDPPGASSTVTGTVTTTESAQAAATMPAAEVDAHKPAQVASLDVAPSDQRSAATATDESKASEVAVPAAAAVSIGKPSDPRRRRTANSESNAATSTNATVAVPASAPLHAAASAPPSAPVATSAPAPPAANAANPAPAVASKAPPSSVASRPTDPRRRNDKGAPRIEKTEMYHRLPRSVRTMLDILINENRLPEAINDNVLTRLMHVTEPIAIKAIENLSQVDLKQIDNLNGFLVGIINRVQERSGATAYRARDASRAPPQQHQGHQQQAPFASMPSFVDNNARGFQHPAVAPDHYGYGDAAGGDPRARRRGPAHGQMPYDRAAAPEYMAQPLSGGQHPGQHPHPYDMAQQPYMQQPQHQPQHQQAYGVAPQQHQQQPQGRHNQHTAGPYGHHPQAQPHSQHSQYAAQQQQQQHLQQHPPRHAMGSAGRFSRHPTIDRAVSALPFSVQNHLLSLVERRVVSSLDELSEKCYEVLGQLSEGLANDVIMRFASANLGHVRNRSGFFIGVINKCKQEYGFND